MRKLILLLPLLLLPAFAIAAHTSPLENAAYRLESSADQFYRQAMHARGDWRLKWQARRFVVLSNRLARQVSYSPRSPRLRVTLNRLDRSFYDLQTTVQYASMRGKNKKLRRRLAQMAIALNRVEKRVANRARLASGRTSGGYARAYYEAGSGASRDRRGRRDRRYRD